MEVNHNRGYKIILAIIWPVSSLFYSIRDYRSPDSQWFFIFGLSFLGYTIGLEGDLEVYAEKFYRFQKISWMQFFQDIISLKQGDFYVELIAKLTNVFSDKHYLFMALLISIYAFLYTSIVKLFIQLMPKFPKKFILIMFIGFALFFTIRNFISIRFYTASLLFIYGLMRYMINKNKIYLVLSSFSPAIHIAFAMSLPILLFIVLINEKFKGAFIVMVLSFFIGQSSITNFLEKSSEGYSDTVVNKKVSSYASEDGAKRLNDRYKAGNFNYKVKIMNGAKSFSDYFISIGILLVLFYNKYMLRDIFVKSLLSLIFLCWSLSNIMMNVSNGDRFTILYLFLGLGLFYVLCVKEYVNKFFVNYLKIGLPAVLVYNFMAIIAANPLFTTNYFISNYIVEWLFF